MKILGVLSLMPCLIGACVAKASDVAGGGRGPEPRMGELSQPHQSATYKLHIELPAALPLCGMVDSFSTMEWFYIPVIPGIRCEQLRLPMDWEQMPDFIVIGPYIDTPMTLESLDDYVRHESFFCAGKNAGGGSGLPRSSDAATSIAPAGNALLGMRTVTCVRRDPKTNRYSKAFLSYKPMPGDSGRGYMVAAYVHLKNRGEADRLLEEIVARLAPLESR